MAINNSSRLKYMVEAVDDYLDSAEGVLNEALRDEMGYQEINTGVLVLETLERVRTARALLDLARR